MKRYIIALALIMVAAVVCAAPGDKRPAVTSAAIGLGATSSATMGSVTATTSVTAPAFNSSAADGYHYILPYNSTAFAGTPLTGMIQTTPTGPQWYTGSAWEAIGSGGGGTWGSITGTLSAQADLQAALDAITAGGITISTGTPSTPGTAYLNDTTHVLTVASSTGYTQFTGSFTAWDTTPAAFAFTDLTDAALSTTQTATPIQITDINYPTAVTATGGTAAICTGATADTCGTFSASPGNVALNQYVSAQHTSSGSNSTAVDTVVTIGGLSDTFTSTTTAAEACSGGTDGAVGNPSTLNVAGSGGCESTCSDSRFYYSAFTPISDGTATRIHCAVYSTSLSYRCEIRDNAGTLLAYGPEHEGTNAATPGDIAHDTLTVVGGGELCLVTGTTYKIGAWIEADAWSSGIIAGNAWGAGVALYTTMAAFDSTWDGTGTQISNGYPLRASVNNSAGNF